MNEYKTTGSKAKLVIGTAALAVTATLLEVVASAFVHPAPEAVAQRQTVIAAQADQAERALALINGEVKAASSGNAPRD